jgi:hypothetical protein
LKRNIFSGGKSPGKQLGYSQEVSLQQKESLQAGSRYTARSEVTAKQEEKSQAKKQVAGAKKKEPYRNTLRF